MDLDEFLAFLRADFDYGTGQAVPFKEDFVQRVAALLSEAQPTSSHLQQLSGMVNTVRSAVRDKFAFKENLIVNGELDLGRASVYDFLYAYITLGRAYLENQLHLAPVFNETDNKLEFFTDGGNGEKKFELNVPSGFYTAEFIAKMKLLYRESKDRTEIYIYTRPADDTGGQSKVSFSTLAEEMTMQVEGLESLRVNSREMCLRLFNANKTAVAEFLNQEPRCKRSVNKLRSALGLDAIPLFNISSVFVNGFIETLQKVSDNPDLLETFHGQIYIPSTMNYIENNPDSCAFHYLAKYTALAVDCDWGGQFPYLCRGSGGSAEKIDSPVYIFDGSDFVSAN